VLRGDGVFAQVFEATPTRVDLRRHDGDAFAPPREIPAGMTAPRLVDVRPGSTRPSDASPRGDMKPETCHPARWRSPRRPRIACGGPVDRAVHCGPA
jgi:hypothetical protein